MGNPPNNDPTLSYQTQPSPAQKAAMAASRSLWSASILFFILAGMMIALLFAGVSSLDRPGTSLSAPLAGTITRSSTPAAKATVIAACILCIAIVAAFAGIGAWAASGVRKSRRSAIWTALVWNGLLLLAMTDIFVEAMLGHSPWFSPATSPAGLLVNWGVRGAFFGTLAVLLFLTERDLWRSRTAEKAYLLSP